MRKLISVLLLTFSISVLAQQRPADLQPIPEPPPPPEGMSDDPGEPQVTIIRRGDDKVEEYRANGKLYMIKVTPPIGYPYFLVDQEGDGTWTPQDATGPELHVPQWKVFSW